MPNENRLLFFDNRELNETDYECVGNIHHWISVYYVDTNEWEVFVHNSHFVVSSSRFVLVRCNKSTPNKLLWTPTFALEEIAQAQHTNTHMKWFGRMIRIKSIAEIVCVNDKHKISEAICSTTERAITTNQPTYISRNKKHVFARLVPSPLYRVHSLGKKVFVLSFSRLYSHIGIYHGLTTVRL